MRGWMKEFDTIVGFTFLVISAVAALARYTWAEWDDFNTPSRHRSVCRKRKDSSRRSAANLDDN